jgi:hypothetical protein
MARVPPPTVDRRNGIVVPTCGSSTSIRSVPSVNVLLLPELDTMVTA